MFAEAGARVDDLLGAALHLGVVPLDGGVVERPAVEVVVEIAAGSGRVVPGSVGVPGFGGLRGAVAGEVRSRATARALRPGSGSADRGGRPAPEPDQHGRSADDRDERSGPQGRLRGVPPPDPAHPARGHDRLVVAVPGGPPFVLRLLEGAEVAAEGGPPELVVEARRADRALEHDVEGAREVGRRAGAVRLPRLLEARNTQGGDAEPDEPGAALGPAPGGRLVPDLSPRARRGPRQGGDRGRVVVGLDLHEEARRLRRMAIDPGGGVRAEPGHGPAVDDRGVVVVGGEHPAGAHRAGVPDHVEE